MNLNDLMQEATNGNMVAQYDLAEYYGKRMQHTDDENTITEYSRQAVHWLKKSAKQGYGPAMDAIAELNLKLDDPSDFSAAPQPLAVEPPPPDVISEFESVSPEPEAAPRAPESVSPRPAEKAFRPNLFLSIMLVVSLLINIFLLVYLFRLQSNEPARRSEPGQSQSTQQPSAAPSTASPTKQPPAPGASPSPTVAPTAAPTPIATPAPTPFWLDLSPYTNLEVVPPQSSLYDSYTYYTVLVSSVLNVRSGPDTKYKVIGEIANGTKVGAVSKEGNWYLVSYHDKYGWVSGTYLTTELSNRPAPQPTTGSTAPSATAVPTASPIPSSSGDLRTW